MLLDFQEVPKCERVKHFNTKDLKEIGTGYLANLLKQMSQSGMTVVDRWFSLGAAIGLLLPRV